MRYFVNDSTKRADTAQSSSSQGWIDWLAQRGFREVSRQEYKAFRQANPEPTTWVVRVSGPNRRRIESLAKSAGCRPQDYAAGIIIAWLNQHGGEVTK